MKTTEELRKSDIAKLKEEAKLLKKDLFKIEFEVKNGQSKSNHEIKKNRRQIARIETILREKTASLSPPKAG